MYSSTTLKCKLTKSNIQARIYLEFNLRPILLSYRNQSTDLYCKSIEWFLLECSIGMIWVKLEIRQWDYYAINVFRFTSVLRSTVWLGEFFLMSNVRFGMILSSNTSELCLLNTNTNSHNQLRRLINPLSISVALI